MKLDSSTIDRFLEPKLLRALARLPLMSRRVVEGAMVGSHRSPFKGFSTEFADHRGYVRGDDLRHLDWKVFSRTERYYIKRYEENTNLRGYIVLDCSNSMAFPRKPKAGQITKYEYACRLAAGLSYVLIRQQDPVGLFMFNDDLVAEIPAMRSLSHLRRMLRTMDEVQPSSRTESGKALTAVASRLKRRGLLLIISDLLDEPDKIVSALAQFRHRGHDAIVIQVLDQDELVFPFEKMVTLRDMETREQVSLDGGEVAAEYARQITAFIERYKKSCFEHNFDYVLASTATPYDSLLTALLTRRKK
ncbi:MAG: DUF58 domain-containing protein [Phycisphaeraceae bacterium]|nr:DUF58 domain-containing protein [Phycisphaeraceae bacterium]